jgi:hypothetical protein
MIVFTIAGKNFSGYIFYNKKTKEKGYCHSREGGNP